MEWDAGAAVIAGLVGTAVMTMVLYMGIAMMPRQMTMNILYMEGSMVARALMPAYVLGGMMHLGMGIMFAIIHTALYQAFNLESGLVGWGVLFGGAHWLVVGMGLGMLATMHPLMRSGEMEAPGAFAIRSPIGTRMGFLMVHLLFGLVVGLVYEALL